MKKIIIEAPDQIVEAIESLMWSIWEADRKYDGLSEIKVETEGVTKVETEDVTHG